MTSPGLQMLIDLAKTGNIKMSTQVDEKFVLLDMTYHPKDDDFVVYSQAMLNDDYDSCIQACVNKINYDIGQGSEKI